MSRFPPPPTNGVVCAFDDGGGDDRRPLFPPLHLDQPRLFFTSEPPFPADTTEDSSAQKDNSADPPVASLLSRIGGLSTDATKENAPSSPTRSKESPAPQSPSSSSSGVRPKPNISNPLFGRALAGVKSDRSVPPPSQPSSNPIPTSTAQPTGSTPRPDAEAVDEPQTGEKMAQNLMDEQGEPTLFVTLNDDRDLHYKLMIKMAGVSPRM